MKRRQKIHGLIYICLFICGLFLSSALGQSGGSSQNESRDTSNKADQNIKSVSKVNPTTLAMEMNIPFASYPGRNGNSLPVGISYSSKLWRMDSFSTYWYSQPYSGARQYVSWLMPVFAEKSAAGWSSSINFPVIEEKLVTYNQLGRITNLSADIYTFNANLTNSQSNLNEDSCTYPDRWDCWRAGINCNPDYCPSSCSYCTGGSGGGSGPGGGGSPFPGSGEGEIPVQDKMYYIKRVHVRIGGSSHEFRKSDSVFGYCVGGPNDGENCESTVNGYVDNLGMFLATDGSGLKLHRTETGSTLYMPDGGRFLFPATSTGGDGEAVLYQATTHVDADGNQSSFIVNANHTVRKFKDTLNREIADFLPQNLHHQEQDEGVQEVNLPGLNGELTQNYELKWLHLKPVPGGIQEGALENQNEELFYYGSYICAEAPEPAIYDTTQSVPNNIMFPYGGNGLRSCNPGSTVQNAERFNGVVLAEVKLPNGKTYDFKYNQFGEITKIVYPDLHYETFTYGKIAPMGGYAGTAYDQTNRGVKERKVFEANGTLTQVWKYDATYDYLSTNKYKITMTAPKGDNAEGIGIKTVRYIHTQSDEDIDFGFSDPKNGSPYEELTYDENNVLRSRSLTEYKVKSVQAGNTGNPNLVTASRDSRVERSVSVMIEGGQALATLSETEYDEPGTANYTPEGQTDPEYFSHLNVKRKKAYHYAVVPLSVAQSGTMAQIAGYFNNNLLSNTAETDYQYDPLYKARGIGSLPIESRVYDHNGNVITKSRTEYDQSNYLNGESGTLSSSLTNTWTDPATDESIPVNSRSKRGKPTTSKVWDDDNNRWISTHTTFDQYGNPRKVWEAVADPDSPSRFVETEYSLDYGFAYPTKVITPGPGDGVHGTNLGSSATTTYDYMTGLPLTSTNEFGQTTATEYEDDLLRPTRVKGINGFVIPITETIYDDDALTVKVRKQIDEQNWDEATTFSDSLGRTFKTQAKDSQGDVFVETKYDLLGRAIAVTNPYRQGDTVYWSKTRYDEMGRAVEAYAPALENAQGDSLGITEYGISSQTGFVGTVVTKTDASGRKSRSFTNVLGQLTRVDEPGSNNQLDSVPQTTPTPNPSPTPPPNYPIDPPSCAINCPNNLTGSEYPMHSTYYEYNVQGKMIKVTQGVQKRYFMYDSLGRLIRVRQPEQEVNNALDKSDPATGNDKWTAKFTYDLFGNVLTTTDAKGVTITNTYDKANRVLTKIFSGEPQGQTTPQVEYFYDGYGLDTTPPATNNYAKGKLTKVTSSISETRYTKFDSFGQPEEMEQRTPFGSEAVADAIPRVSKYKYDFGGRLIEETYPSGRIVKNTFESDNDLANVVSKAASQVGFKTYVSNFSYTAAGSPSQMQLGNGRWETYKFNTRQQVEELGLGNAYNDTSLWKINFIYGELESNGSIDLAKNTGNIAKQSITIGGMAQPFIQTYKYDSLYRITEAKEVNGTGTTANWSQQFSYDRYGNRIGFNQQIGQLTTGNLPTVNTATNRFADNQGFKYDKAGNIIEDIDLQQIRSFIFNGDNKQVEINRNGTLVGRYFYDGEGNRVKKQTEQEVTIFVYSTGKLVAEYSTKMPDNPTTNYMTTDHLGSPRVVTDKLGQIRSRRDFMPFGEELAMDANYRTAGLKYGVADEVRQKFTGYQKDIESELDFAEARMYNNQHGRFTAVDPLLASGKSENPQTFNRYIYTSNNPIIRIDPDGLLWYAKYNEDTGRFSLKWFGRRDKVEDGYYIYFGSLQYPLDDGTNNWIWLNPNGPNKRGFSDFDKNGWSIGSQPLAFEYIHPCLTPLSNCNSVGLQDATIGHVLDFQGLRGAGTALKEGLEFGISYFARNEARVQATRFRITNKLIDRKNVAIMQYEIEGVGSGTEIAVSGIKNGKKAMPSGTIGMPPDPVFKPTSVLGRVRDSDSEYKLFEYLAGGIHDINASGRVFIYTERKICGSCRGVSNQFREMFPNIKVVVRDKGKLR